MKREAEIGVMRPQAKDAWGHWLLAEARKDPALEAWEGARPSQQLDGGLWASRTVRQYISIVFSLQMCGALLPHPRKRVSLPKFTWLVNGRTGV